MSPERRPAGTGSLLVRTDAAGAETWYGKWRVGERQTMRSLGRRRPPGGRTGLTRAQAEAELRRRIEESGADHNRERVAFTRLADRFLAHKRTIGLRRSTLDDYTRTLHRRLAPFFCDRELRAITPADVEAYTAASLARGISARTVNHELGLLSSLFRYAIRHGLVRDNPVRAAERPRLLHRDPDIRRLDLAELDALLAAVPDDPLGATDRVLYLTAAMTGMRRGELVALRRQDVDLAAGVIRVRRSHSDGRIGPPKSLRSNRAIPIADRLALELGAHLVRGQHRAPDDLVFCHPEIGTVYDPSRLRKRFVEACARAGLRPTRFHDLRHTFGTRMAAAGAPLRSIQEWMGHADQRATMIYADYAPDMSNGALYAARAFASPTTGDLLDAVSPANRVRQDPNVRSHHG